MQIQNLPNSFVSDCYTHSAVNSLPTEILLHIFSFLSVSSTARVMLVCKQWNQLSNDDFIWHLHFIRDFSKFSSQRIQTKRDYANLRKHSFLLNLVNKKSIYLHFVDSNFKINFSQIFVSEDENKILIAKPLYTRGMITIWTLDKSQVRNIYSDFRIDKIKLSSDGEKIITIGKLNYKKQIKILNFESAILNSYSIKQKKYAISPSGNKILIFKHEVKNLYIRDINKSRSLLELPYFLKKAVFSYDDSKILLITDTLLILWDLESNLELKKFAIKSKRSKAAFSQNGFKFALGYAKGEKSVVEIHDITNGNLLKKWKIPGTKIKSLEFLLGDIALATTDIIDGNETSRVWNVETGQLLQSFEGRLTASGRVLLMKKADNSIILLTFSSGKN